MEKINKELISLSEAAKIAGLTPEHLNLMARKKKLEAQKLGRNWYTTEEWLGKFLAETEKSKNYKKGILPVRKIEPPKIERKGKIFEVMKRVKGEEGEKWEEGEIYIREEGDERGEKGRKGKKGKRGERVAPGWRFSFSTLALAAVLIFIFFASPFFKYQMEKDENLQKIYDSIDQISFFNADSGMVLGEEADGADQTLRGAALASENFKVKQIRFGGFGGETSVLSDESVDLEIEDVRSETFVTKKQDEAKLVIYWKTNKLAVSEVEYSKMGGANPKKAKEAGYGFNHGIVVPGLELGTAYVYQIKAKDRWGNIMKTGNFSVYSGSKTVSVVELITKEFEKLFGWARR